MSYIRLIVLKCVFFRCTLEKMVNPRGVVEVNWELKIVMNCLGHLHSSTNSAKLVYFYLPRATKICPGFHNSSRGRLFESHLRYKKISDRWSDSVKWTYAQNLLSAINFLGLRNLLTDNRDNSTIQSLMFEQTKF